MDSNPLSLGEKILLLTKEIPLAVLAREIGLSHQALLNLVQDKAANPKLTTLLSVCDFFKISLDYFTCETREDCLDHLKRQRLKHATDLIREIQAISCHLSPKGQHNALMVLRWIALRHGQALPEEDRKNDQHDSGPQ